MNRLGLATSGEIASFFALVTPQEAKAWLLRALADGRVIEVDPTFGGATGPANGMLALNADGSFTYTPDAGFEGEDTFSYRLRTLIDESSNPVGDPFAYSSPATVVVRVSAPDCPADLAAPAGALDIFDVIEYLALFDAQDPAADLAAPAGVFDFFDVVEYLGEFDEGC